jgi:hypothetical protein
MKTTVLAIIAISALIGVATPAGANPFSSKEFWDQQERFSGGSNGR